MPPSLRTMNLIWPDQQPELGEEPVILRAWRPDDAAAVYEACQDESLQEYTTVPVPYEMTHAEQFIASATEAWAAHSDAYFAIVDADDVLVGAITLMHVDDAQREAEVGYWVADWARGNRVARQAITTLGEWAITKLELERLVMKIQRENVPSIAAALAAGAVPTGETIDVEVRGELRNLGIYELT